MYTFNYHVPKNVNEAITIFKDSEEPKYLAGGMTLVASMKQRLISPTDVIDIKKIKNLDNIEINNNILKIGALCTHDQIAKDSNVLKALENFSFLANGIGDPAVRKIGTIGGSLSNSDPAADWPAAVLALKTNIFTNNRTIKNEDFFTGMFETCLEENELLTSVEIELPDFFNYIKFPNPASKYAVVGVSIAIYETEVRVSVTGASHTPFMAKEISEALSSNINSDFPKKSVPMDDLNNDIHASAEYRQNLIDVLTKQLINSYS